MVDKTRARRGIIPFQDMRPENWANLAIAALIAFYSITVLLDTYWNNLFAGIASDFAASWSAGYIANHMGYASVYDIQRMAQIQASLSPRSGEIIQSLPVIPVPYLPVFILPFQLLALIGPVPAYWIWTVINFLGLLLYLWLFIKNANQTQSAWRPVLLAAVSLPVFLNLFYGQFNLPLTISIGEFMRSAISGKPFRAGFWLGGLLLKPQSLVLLGLVLLLQRSFKTIAGMVSSGLAILLFSLGLVGKSGMEAIVQMWLGYVAGLPTNNPEIMMNWRMMGIQIGRLSNPQIGWTITILGILLTASATLYLWRRQHKPNSITFVIALAGTLAATGLVAWHSHDHMAMLLLPPLIYLYQSGYPPFKNLLEWWVFVPAFGYLAKFVLASFAKVFPGLPTDTMLLLNFLHGGGLFILNLYFLYWSVGQSRYSDFSTRQQPETI